MMQSSARCFVLVVGLLAALSGPPSTCADEAWRTDGQRLHGQLTLNGGELHFKPTAGADLSLADIKRYRFAEKDLPPFRVGAGRRVMLRDGERITGQLLGLSKEKLVLHTAWAARLELPRDAVASVDPLPGWRTVVDEDFHDGLKAFSTTGDPGLTKAEADAEAKAVILRAIGQTLTYTRPQSLAAGRVGVNFEEKEPASGARWSLEMLFQQGQRSRRLSVVVAGEGDQYAVETAALEGTARKVARTPGPHRVLVQFSKQALRVTCDDEALWYNLEEGPGLPLTRVTMQCQRLAAERPVQGAIAWSEFCLERAVVEHPRPPVEGEQDEVRLLDDDQLFGRILQADRHTLQIEGRFGKRPFLWTQLAGCSFRHPAVGPKVNERASVRLRIDSGLCPEADLLVGNVTALDERRLVLRHALLGEVTLERGRVRELQPLPSSSK
jgi:hypothetical protein